MNEEKILDDINFCLEGEYITPEHYEAIQGLLDLYRSKTEQLNTALNSLKKEKEKNKELIQGQVKTLDEILQPELLKKYISKDKIREKIKECEEAMNKVKQLVIKKDNNSK